jgi:ATP adenylyltransferase
MKHIWSPWRMEYVEKSTEQGRCLFCDQLAQSDGLENLILHRGQHAFVILNRYPYTNGHMMVVPFEHKPSFDALDEKVLSEVMILASEALVVLREAYGAESFNVGANIGTAAGAGVADHVHMHVLPRWKGDTSFMTTTGEVRVIPEALESTFARLQAVWKNRRK